MTGVIWSPVHHDKFIVWGPDITLYEVSRLKEIEKKTSFTQISPTRGAVVVASQSASTVRCVDISAITEHPDPLLALGHTTGSVSLTSLKQSFDPLGLVGREFVPRYPRLCNSVSWSSSETNLLAVALDKHRSDHCILLWDVNRVPPRDNTNDSASASGAATATEAMEPEAPLAEMGLSETAHSVSWTNCANRTLVASMNLKFIKLFDLRDLTNKAVSTATTRYCYGACADPFNWWQIASRGEHVICVWDGRNLIRPLHTLPQAGPVSVVQWCPTRRNLLLSLQRDSSTIRLHDIQQTNSDSKHGQNYEDLMSGIAIEAEAEEVIAGGVLQRDVNITPQSMTAFSCHPTHEARLVALTTNGNLVDYTVCERGTVSWGAGAGGGGGGGGLVWSGGGGLLRHMGQDFYHALKDISYVMNRRAQTEYGLKPDLWQNADLADDESLSALWNFLALSKALVEDGCIRNSQFKHPGVMSVLTPSREGSYRPEVMRSIIPDLPNRRVTLYRSTARAWALQLCGWGWGFESCTAGVERFEAEGTPCRAAAVAAFHLRLRTAVDVLARAHNPQLRVVALAIAGLTEERLWRETLDAAVPALPDPYLRALLHFLAASAPAPQPPATANGTGACAQNTQFHLDAVLNETEMRLEDRVAFACMYLSDPALAEYLSTECQNFVRAGELSGMLLTGTSPEGVALLQKWLENTGDVQSVALVAARCFTVDLLKMPEVACWLDSYRALLDSWKLWWARCALDTWAGSGVGAGGADTGSRVCAACSYCGKSVAAPPRPRPPHLARLPPPAAKMKQISSCPHCRKPLPRCGVCSLHVGGAGAFPAWLAWCAACRHGGHAHHLLHWFTEHSECPVSSCNCRCNSLDPPDTNSNI